MLLLRRYHIEISTKANQAIGRFYDWILFTKIEQNSKNI